MPLLTLALLALTALPTVAQSEAPSVSPAASDTGEAAETVQPDIILVIVDDLAYIPDDRVLERLPNIRDLWLDGGLRFTHMYDETPLCCPARAALLSGDHTLTHGVITNDGDPLDPAVTIATRLQDAGYHTMMVGKYLNDYDGTRQPPGWDRVSMRETVTVPSFTVDGELIEYPGTHFDQVVRETAAEWLREAPADEPVFAWVAPRAPHRHPQRCGKGQFGCQYLPDVMRQDRRAEACRGIRDYKPPNYATPPSDRFPPWAMPDWPDGWPLRRICESLLVVDRMVADLVEAQAERDRPAYFVFLSDNGMAWGQDGFPLKHVPPATRKPFYVAGPGIEAGKTDALFSNVDIAPTLAELGGAEPPSGSGISLVPHLTGQTTVGRDEILEIMPADPRGKYDGWAALRTPERHYVRWDKGERELYDVREDPWGQRNLVRQEPKVARAMDARLDELIEASRPAGA